MPDQRVLSVSMSLIMILFAAGCGSQPQQTPESDRAAAENSSTEEQAEQKSPPAN
jgi:predicted small lipoprotein YifL